MADSSKEVMYCVKNELGNLTSHLAFNEDNLRREFEQNYEIYHGKGWTIVKVQVTEIE